MNQSNETQKALKIAFIAARWHANIVDEAYKGFASRIAENAPELNQIEKFDVPGAFEIPLLAQKLARTGQYHAIVASGFVVDGGIYRHDFVASAVIDGLMRVQLDENVPVFSVVLTPHHFHETAFHEKIFFDHFTQKGQEAADALIMLHQTNKKIPA
ncbi:MULTISPECIES: 6,7-dimethyl-8-ribityllumazine synthase [unclassified Bartonella]|uniref:6,7-dimethyl-8-ribityllumazine synthase n=1 Tax=unclassified Bartonella TaxID=2645622 RepID=UPI0015FAFBB2|nr:MULTISPECIES: 6,7-dimethyl-8-ribityllumazine synthase [unclassified Bartonella]UXN05601.1 6,7-dimethyl-8-ribityllumazine synthase [Bartonella sp. HY761]